MQAAAGLLLTFGIVNYFTGWKNELAAMRGVNEKILFLVLALFTAGLIISFMHLGNIKNAYNALNNITYSWLSREILFVIIFGFMCLLYTIMYKRNIFDVNIQGSILFLAIFAGMMLIWIMSKVYMIEIVPAWNSFYTPASFYWWSFITGGIIFIAASVFLLARKGVDIASLPAAVGVIKFIAAVVILFLVAELIVWFVHLLVLNGGERAAKESFEIIVNGNLVWVIVKLALQGVSIYLLYSFHSSLAKGTPNINLLYIITLLIIIAGIAGRYIFYAAFNRVGI
jgi:anaerobic dimethyl sulfoxide reductase subunit C (anchor subunit)